MKKNIILNKWKLKSSAELKKYGDKITSINYNSDMWFNAIVPGSVISTFVENNIYKDPYYDRNIIKIPGYKHGKNSLFSNHYMPDDSPFRESFWYRNRFSVPEDWKGKNICLEFKGINFKGEVWLNRKRIASTAEIAGSYRIYRFEITKNLYFDRDNILAVKVKAPQPDDLGITFIDWNPVPPDDSMGIWRPVEISVFEKISVNDTFVKSKLINENKKAKLTIITELENTNDKDEEIDLSLNIEHNNQLIEINKKVKINAKEKKEITIDSNQFSELIIENPKLWWPYQMGEANLCTLEIKAKLLNDNQIIFDEEKIEFGIREVKSYLNKTGSRVFEINGKRVQLRGAAWTSDLMLRESKVQDEIDINYLKNLNFNTVRLEGKMASDYFWELCNKEGILVIGGWPCCNHWEKWEKWKEEDLSIAKKSTRSQLKRLRANPAFIAWFYGSDFPPPLKVEREYLKVIKECSLAIPAISSAADKETVLTGKPGVKMSGPYSYVPPQYWYDNNMPGKAGKFNTETGPDMCLPEYDSLKKFIKENQLKYNSESWNLHAGLSEFDNTDYLDQIIKARFSDYTDQFDDLKNYLKASNFIAYQSWKAMYEAHIKNWPQSTGVIGWMLNSAWPSLIWQLYDYYNLPNGAFYGSKKGSDLLKLIFAYDDQKIYLTNQTFKNKNNLSAEIYLYNNKSELEYSMQKEIEFSQKNSKKILSNLNKKINNKGNILFLYLKDKNNLINKNVYFLSNNQDIYQEENDKFWYCRPLEKIADFNFLINKTKKADYKIENNKLSKEKDEINLSLIITNNNDNLSIMNNIKLYTQKGHRISPVYLNDNYITLRENESEKITAKIRLREVPSYIKSELLESDIKIEIDSLNFS